MENAYMKHVKENCFVLIEALNHAGEIEVTEEQLRRFFSRYCVVTGYCTEDQFEAEKQNTYNGIKDVFAALSILNLTPKTVKPEDHRRINKVQHDLWALHRIEEGWSYGETKDKVLKLNPCMKEFELLTEKEIAYDEMFLELVLEIFG